jgi:sugar transferase (PEP-CTERM/EpsH1 system associated)
MTHLGVYQTSREDDAIGNPKSSILHSKSPPPLVVHIIHRLAVGGLENGLVNLINAIDPARYRHAIISLTEYTDFRKRIRHPDVPVIALHKREGNTLRPHLRIWQLLGKLRPAIVHTRNLPALEFLPVAAVAGIRGRIHGEHGRDIYDVDGSSRKYTLLRKAVNPFVSRYTAVSKDLTQWLGRMVGGDRVIHICNGVDTDRFYARPRTRQPLGPEGFAGEGTILVGTVGRMQAVKDQVTLVRAFLRLIQTDNDARKRLRLIMVGDGPLREEAQKLLCISGAEHLAWLPGERRDIPEIMRALDLFVLPSIAEGISNTILEAMSTGLPVVATRVGGNSELVVEGKTGSLVPASDPTAMATAIRAYLRDPGKLLENGMAGRKRVEKHFSIDSMVSGYLNVYDTVLSEVGHCSG